MELKFKNLEGNEESITDIIPAKIREESYYPEYPSAYIDLDYGGASQGFGGYFLTGREITWRKLVLDSILGRSWDKIKYSDPRVLDRKKFNEAITGQSVLAYRQERVLGIGSSLENAFFPKASQEFLRDDRKNLKMAFPSFSTIMRWTDEFEADLSIEEMRELIRLGAALLEIDLDSSVEERLNKKIASINSEILEKRKQEKIYGQSQSDEISKLEWDRKDIENDLKNLPKEIEKVSAFLLSLIQSVIKKYDEEMEMTDEKLKNSIIESIAEDYGMTADKVIELGEFKSMIEERVNNALERLEKRKTRLQEIRPEIEEEIEKAQEILEKTKIYNEERKAKDLKTGTGEFGEE